MFCLVFCDFYKYGVLMNLDQYLIMASKWGEAEQKTSYMIPVNDSAMVHLAQVFPSINEFLFRKVA